MDFGMLLVCFSGLDVGNCGFVLIFILKGASLQHPGKFLHFGCWKVRFLAVLMIF
jgi:hypothetical protein